MEQHQCTTTQRKGKHLTKEERASIEAMRRGTGVTGAPGSAPGSPINE